MNKPSLYLAGALHTATQRQYLEALTEKLTAHYNVYLPHRDGGRYTELLKTQPMERAAAAIMNADTVALQEADILLAVVFGTHLSDAGVCFEVGYARAIDLPCFALAPDLDTSARFNPLLRATFVQVYHDWAQVLPILHSSD